MELIGLVRMIRLQEGNLLNFDEVYRQYLCISLTRTYIESFILGFGALTIVIGTRKIDLSISIINYKI